LAIYSRAAGPAKFDKDQKALRYPFASARAGVFARRNSSLGVSQRGRDVQAQEAQVALAISSTQA
jgi:hypothetical protein